MDYTDPEAEDRLTELIDAYQRQLRAFEVPNDIETAASAELSSIQAQLGSPHPDAELIANGIQSLWELAHRIGCGEAAQLLIEHFHEFGIA